MQVTIDEATLFGSDNGNLRVRKKSALIRHRRSCSQHDRSRDDTFTANYARDKMQFWLASFLPVSQMGQLATGKQCLSKYRDSKSICFASQLR